MNLIIINLRVTLGSWLHTKGYNVSISCSIYIIFYIGYTTQEGFIFINTLFSTFFNSLCFDYFSSSVMRKCLLVRSSFIKHRIKIDEIFKVLGMSIILQIKYNIGCFYCQKTRCDSDLNISCRVLICKE